MGLPISLVNVPQVASRDVQDATSAVSWQAGALRTRQPPKYARKRNKTRGTSQTMVQGTWEKMRMRHTPPVVHHSSSVEFVASEGEMGERGGGGVET